MTPPAPAYAHDVAGNDASTWATEATDLVRAASGGLLFGIPLLYTVEVLWTGQHTSPPRMLVVLLLSFLPLLVLNRTEGFRSKRDVTFVDAVTDAVEGVALAIVLVFGALVLLGEVDTDTPPRIALGKMAYQVMPFCIGIGVARHILRPKGGDRDNDGSDGDAPRREGESRDHRINGTVADIGASVIGSIFVALSIAPTDEVPLLAASRSPQHLLAIIGVSLVVAYSIVFVAGFTGQQQRHHQEGALQHPVTETVVSYLAALASSWAMLAIFQRADGPWHVTLAHVVVLGLPAAIGGAAGRLAV